MTRSSVHCLVYIVPWVVERSGRNFAMYWTMSQSLFTSDTSVSGCMSLMAFTFLSSIFTSSFVMTCPWNEISLSPISWLPLFKIICLSWHLSRTSCNFLSWSRLASWSPPKASYDNAVHYAENAIHFPNTSSSFFFFWNTVFHLRLLVQRVIVPICIFQNGLLLLSVC